jgi:hypothetical protein
MCWTGSDLFLSSRREQARTDGDEPELPSSFSAAVPFASQVPFAFLLRGSRLVPLLSLGTSLHLCRSVDRAVFPSPACPVSDLPPAPVCLAVPFYLRSFVPVISSLPRELGLLLLGSASGLVLRFHRCSIFLLILSSCSASRPVSLLETFASHGANSQRRRCQYRVYFWRVQCSSSAALHFMVQLL